MQWASLWWVVLFISLTADWQCRRVQVDVIDVPLCQLYLSYASEKIGYTDVFHMSRKMFCFDKGVRVNLVRVQAQKLHQYNLHSARTKSWSV